MPSISCFWAVRKPVRIRFETRVVLPRNCPSLSFALVRVLGVTIHELDIHDAPHNLYFHPLAKFPGPEFGAAAHLYEFYWSIVRDGEFAWKIERMHQKHGTSRNHLQCLHLHLRSRVLLLRVG